jgi:hypothetical protein
MLALALVGMPALLFPAPFHRKLELTEPPMRGSDVTILQNLLRRAPHGCALACGCGCSHTFDRPTGDALACFTGNRTRAFDVAAAHHVLQNLADDHWRDDGVPAAKTGHLYKLIIPVHRNRSIETDATLLDANNTILYRFRVRAHGHDVDAAGQPIDGRAWPDLTDDGCPDGASSQGCVGLNSFSRDGNTPTGLSEVDLNSPEAEAELYGPYPINRFVRGLQGNAGVVLGSDGLAPIRSGILMHTGQWAQHSRWRGGAPMPNSAGCVHAEPAAIEAVWKLLVARGVVVRQNTNGTLPYPHRPQGLAAVYQVA